MARKQNVLLLNDSDLGPAMAALNERQRDYVRGKVFLGLDNAAAARAAGYSIATKSGTGHKTPWWLAHHPGVQDAILEESRKLLRSEGPRSIHTLVQIRDTADAAPRDRIKAAVELLNRAGMNAITETHHTVTHQLSEAEQDKRILALCAELGVAESEARKMLVAPADFKKNAAGVFELEPKPEKVRTEAEQKKYEIDRAADRRFKARRKMTLEERDADRAAVKQKESERKFEAGRRAFREAQERLQDGTITDVEFEEISTTPNNVDINLPTDDDDLSDVL